MIEALHGKLLPKHPDRPVSITPSKNPEGPSLPVIKLQIKNLPPDRDPVPFDPSGGETEESAVSKEGINLSADKIRDLFTPYGLVLKASLTKSKIDHLRTAVVVRKKT
jgi:hypothetical protein